MSLILLTIFIKLFIYQFLYNLFIKIEFINELYTKNIKLMDNINLIELLINTASKSNMAHKHGCVIMFMKEPTEELSRLAVQQNRNAIYFVKEPFCSQLKIELNII